MRDSIRLEVPTLLAEYDTKRPDQHPDTSPQETGDDDGHDVEGGQGGDIEGHHGGDVEGHQGGDVDGHAGGDADGTSQSRTTKSGLLVRSLPSAVSALDGWLGAEDSPEIHRASKPAPSAAALARLNNKA